MSVRCAECQCAPQDCLGENAGKQHCGNCTKEICCCTSIHRKPISVKKLNLTMENSDCCISGICKENKMDAIAHAAPVAEPKTKLQSIVKFLRNVRSLYAAALGIEILCIAAAELGENTGLYVLGFNHIGVPFAYTMGYGLASFTTFATILGRYKYGSDSKIDSCCSVLEQDESKSFVSNLFITFKNFGLGLKKIKDLPKQPNLREILKSTITILITAETACIITAETVDVIFYRHALYLSIPLALLAGAFTVVVPEAYRMMGRSKN